MSGAKRFLATTDHKPLSVAVSLVGTHREAAGLRGCILLSINRLSLSAIWRVEKQSPILLDDCRAIAHELRRLS